MARVALVTGGSRGIGLACARQLAEAGHRVAVTVRSEPPAELAALGVLAVPCDVTDSAQVDQAFSTIEAELDPVDILVSNAGITRDGLVLRMNDDDFSAVVDTNLTGGFRVAKRAVKTMMRARFGRIVFISSVVGTGGQAGQANYAASKAGLVGLARSFAKEFASRGITVNVVAPGPVATDMLDALNDDQVASIVDAVPLGRLGSPDDIAATVRFLASDEAGYITGAVIPVDGGLGMAG
ncbi:MAG: 3-oxoacyl-[acyl-carrier-protein] reductase [Acidimicrobiia bacterium]|nr:3-oxoacyl-[acyl-carrier-protein] reductase [Acidimicrobiia bacterium]